MNGRVTTAVGVTLSFPLSCPEATWKAAVHDLTRKLQHYNNPAIDVGGMPCETVEDGTVKCRITDVALLSGTGNDPMRFGAMVRILLEEIIPKYVIWTNVAGLSAIPSPG